jgi:cyclophilin family peptidyl-prolyl cis-trans isomerase
VDVAPYFPDLAKPGIYNLKFKAGEVESDPVEVMVAHPYDPDLDYSATLKTAFGNMTFDLLESVAPDHVRNFVDLARQGFYDGTFFHIIAKGEVVMGGDKAGDGSGGVAYFLPPEISTLPHERGTLSSVRTQGPDNGAQFFIDLRRKPEFDGNFTVFGTITSGEATLQQLENVPTTGNASQPFFKPLENVVLNEVTITASPKAAPAGEEAESGEEEGQGESF